MPPMVPSVSSCPIQDLGSFLSLSADTLLALRPDALMVPPVRYFSSTRESVTMTGSVQNPSSGAKNFYCHDFVPQRTTMSIHGG